MSFTRAFPRSPGKCQLRSVKCCLGILDLVTSVLHNTERASRKEALQAAEGGGEESTPERRKELTAVPDHILHPGVLEQPVQPRDPRVQALRRQVDGPVDRAALCRKPRPVSKSPVLRRLSFSVPPLPSAEHPRLREPHLVVIAAHIDQHTILGLGPQKRQHLVRGHHAELRLVRPRLRERRVPIPTSCH